MPNEITIEFIKKEIQKSEFDWVNLDHDGKRIGKSRCEISGKQITIYSVNVFPEFKGRGFGNQFIVELKKHFDVIIADRVRFTAIGFWEKMDFVRRNEDDFIWDKH